MRYNLKFKAAKNTKTNPKNNPKNSEKKKLALRAVNLQAVIDDPSLDQTLIMSPGTSGGRTANCHPRGSATDENA